MELDRGGELALVQIDFSAAFDRVDHGGLVFKLREAGVCGMILKVFQNLLSSRTQRVKVDGVCSSSIDVVSGVPQGNVLGPLLFLLYIADLPGLLQNVLVGYADYSTLLCRIPHPRDRSSVAASLNDDLAVISDWCSRWGMLVNPSKTRGMLISCSRTVEPLFPDLVVDGTVVEMVSELKILGVILDSKFAFEKQVRQNFVYCFCLEEGWYFEEDNECFSRCRCCCQMLLGINTPCARVLFSSLDVCSHFPPVVA